MIYNVEVKNRIITLNSVIEEENGTSAQGVGGNKGDKVYFTLDAEWLELFGTTELKAMFIWKGKYYMSLLEMDKGGGQIYCDAPIIYNSNNFYLGIYAGEAADESPYKSTTRVEIPCKLSIRDYTNSPHDDYGGNYTDLANEAADRAESAATRAEEAAERAESIGGGSGGSVDIDSTLTQSGKAADAKVTGDRLKAVENVIADMNYKPITASMSVSPNISEIGSSVSRTVLSWSVSKSTKSIILTLPTGSSVSVNGNTSYTDTNTYITNKTWTLKATEENGKSDGTFATATVTASLSFLNGVYYGVSSNGSIDNEDSAEIFAFTKNLRSSKLTSFSVNAGDGEYIYYCLPSRMGTCSFKVGGFDGGFTLQSEGSFTNASGYTETYYIYRSDNASLGATSVTVS